MAVDCAFGTGLRYKWRTMRLIPGFRGRVCPIEFAVTLCAAKIETRQRLLRANLEKNNYKDGERERICMNSTSIFL